MTGKILTALTKIEADAHWSDGRIEKALAIYQSLLAKSPNMTPNTRTLVEKRIKLLKKEMKNPPLQEGYRDIDRAIQKIQKTGGHMESVPDLRKSIKNYYHKGLYADALENLKLLIRQSEVDEFCITGVAGCIMRLHPIKDLAVGTDLFLTETFNNADQASKFKMKLAKKMANSGYARHAEILDRHQDRFESPF